MGGRVCGNFACPLATLRGMLRRPRTVPEHLRAAWDAFHAQAERVETARRALLGCLPVGRVDPAPVPVGLDLVRDELDAVRSELDVWRIPALEAQWDAVRDAVDEAAGAIGEARRVATSSFELEELLEAVGDVVAPLDAWAEAERAWLRLRVREPHPRR